MWVHLITWWKTQECTFVIFGNYVFVQFEPKPSYKRKLLLKICPFTMHDCQFASCFAMDNSPRYLYYKELSEIEHPCQCLLYKSYLESRSLWLQTTKRLNDIFLVFICHLRCLKKNPLCGLLLLKVLYTLWLLNRCHSMLVFTISLSSQ